MLERLDRAFCDGWRHFWKWWSVWLHTIGTTLGGLLLLVPQMPAEIQELIPLKVRVLAIAIWYAGGLWARLKQQKGAGNAN